MKLQGLLIVLLEAAVLAVSTGAQCPSIPAYAGANYGAFESWCTGTAHGRVASAGTGQWKCVDCPTSSAGSTMWDGLLWKMLGLDPGSQMAAKERAARKAAMIRAIEDERQAAIQRQDAERVRFLDEVATRLQTGELRLKGLSPQNDLQLKLSPLGPVKFTEFMATPATSTTSAQLTLKTGDDATRSMQPTTNASSAGVINPTPPTPLSDPNALSPDAKQFAQMLSKLSPAEQQKFLAALNEASTQETTTTTSTTEQPSGNSPDAMKKAETLTLKLSTDQKTADDLKAAANSGASLEQAATDAQKQFDGLQRPGAAAPGQASPTEVAAATTATQTQTDSVPGTQSAMAAKQKFVVPDWHPEGWVGPASKGEANLKFVSETQKRGNCSGADQQAVLAKIAVKADQLAGVERDINRLNAASPRLQAELEETATQMRRDRDAFIDDMVSKLTSQLAGANELLKGTKFADDAEALSQYEELAGKINELTGRVQTVRSGSGDQRAALLKEIFLEVSYALQPSRIAALQRKLGPTFRFATELLDAGQAGVDTLEMFAKIVAQSANVDRLNGEVDARNRALAAIEPLHKKLSAEVDALKHDPALTTCIPK